MSKTLPKALTILALAVVATSSARTESRGFDADALRRHVEYLSSDALVGRETGEAGVRKAERYIAKELKKAGLTPLPGRDDYWVDFTLYRQGYDASTSMALRFGGRPKKGRLGLDFRPFGFSDEGLVEAPVVFVGYGITAPEYEYDDYASIDVEGKIVLMLRHEPGETDPDSSFDGSENSRHALFNTKARNARDHGAAGMLLVTDPLNHGPSDDLRVGGQLHLSPPAAREAEETDGETFVAVQISQATAEALVGSAGHALDQMQRAVDGGARPSGFPLGETTARIEVRASPTAAKLPARNVAGYLEGSDPRLKDEWVLIGGHHDHVGGHDGEGDTVYNGADDNASGVAGVIELARAFGRRAERPRRSMVFVTFTAEEKGLLGSRALVRQELIPIEPVVFMLNLDMIGRNPERELQLFGDGYMRGLREIVEQANAEVGLELDYGGVRYAGNSDHDAFYRASVPFSFFFTGIHEDYHQLGDHADKLDYQRMEAIVRLGYAMLETIADADERPGFINHVAWLGARIEVLDGEGGPQAVITGVDEGSRAAEAGLERGDVVSGFDDEMPDDPERVGRQFNEIEPGTEVVLAIRRGGDEQAIRVARAKTGYMGVGPGPLGEDQRKASGLHDDDQGFLLRQVMAGGPSDRAGLREGDIVIAISGRPVGLSDLREHLMQIGAGETVEITFIRDGGRQTLPVTLTERPRPN